MTLVNQVHAQDFDKQLAVFKSLGYKLNPGVTRDFIYKDVIDNQGLDVDPVAEFEHHPFVRLYYYLGWRNPEIQSYNFTEQCIWFDLDFFDQSSQYKWFMERMGAITGGEITFAQILIETDTVDFEWIIFTVNGIPKRWKLEKRGHISDSFIQRFAYLTEELNTKGRYTYFDDGGQQFVIDYANEQQQNDFIRRTGLKREWLGEGNHFAEPED